MRQSRMWSHLRCRDVLGPAWRMQTACQCRPRRQAPWGPGRWVTISCDGRQCSMSAVPEPSPLAPRVSPALVGWRCRRHRAYDWRTRRRSPHRLSSSSRRTSPGSDVQRGPDVQQGVESQPGLSSWFHQGFPPWRPSWWCWWPPWWRHSDSGCESGVHRDRTWRQWQRWQRGSC